MADPTTIKIPDVIVVPETAIVPSTGVTMQCPVRLGIKADGSDLKTLPIEALVSARGRNRIIVRNVAKQKAGGVNQSGSVKELWTQDDYLVTVTGTLYSGDDDKYPEEWVTFLNGLFRSRKSLIIISKLTDTLGVRSIVVEEWEFPETKGVAYQNFQFRGISDDSTFELF